MAGNLTAQVRNIADVTIAVANGDLSKKITVDVRGEILELKDIINVMVDQLRSFASEVTRVAREVGPEGRLGGQANVQGVAGTWKDLTDSVNFMASNLTGQVRNIAEVTTAVARGDLSKKITVDVKGEILELKDTINVMVDQLNSFASEVTRVAREVGTEGKLGGQAEVRGVGGTWKDLTDSVNSMARNLTAQVRGIAGVVTAVAKGDLKKKLTVEARGEIASLASTINELTDTLAIFADQVTTVAREVGVEGKLGGQANVPGASGTWKNLTDNVNQLAANLTTQVRAIADVATAVTRGDLTRSVTVDARGEVAVLKDNINEMIRNLKDTTHKNAEQDWLKTNLARFTRLLQGQRELETVVKLILSELAPLVDAQLGVFYMMEGLDDDARLKLVAAYGYRARRNLPTEFRPGEGLVGQCSLEQKRIVVSNVPLDYLRITSSLGAAVPRNVVVLPVLFEQQVKAVIELASFDSFSPTHLAFLDQLMESIGVVLNNIEANSRTESLLTQSQTLARELQSGQEELQKTNEELAEKARLLSEQYIEVEHKNREVEQARLALEDKAAQLALSSKYKSEFLANMSHELRTPLNSLLILAQQLAENPQQNLSVKQVEYANIIHGSGTDLLTLINDILDLSKIESGTVTLEMSELSFDMLRDYVERTFRHMAEARRLDFRIELESDLPPAIMTDPMRLQQVLRNLLSNAFKFTELGGVCLEVGRAAGGWSADHTQLNTAGTVVGFSVSDTGVGIAKDKLRLIFEAFQQADGTTSRRYGGTGLGLSISRELARLLGGEIVVESTLGQGSRFTLYVPLQAFSTAGFEESPRVSESERDIMRTLATSQELQLPRRTVEDDREVIRSGDQAVMIVEDDSVFAQILLDAARENGYRGLVTLHGNSAHALAREFQPCAIMLDLSLPDIEGWKVLDQLKHDIDTRHIPVHILSGKDAAERALRQGARSYLIKPVSRERLQEEFADIRDYIGRERKNLLIVEGDESERADLIELLGADDLTIRTAATSQETFDAIEREQVDCVVFDPALSDISGFDLLAKMAADPRMRAVPVVVYTDKALSRTEVAQLKRLAQSVIVKDARSPERLLDETALFLHRRFTRMTEAQRRMLGSDYELERALRGKKVLIVDDDVRNIFALTTVLERHHMLVSFAENGRDGIDMLNRVPDTDIVLMDIMMPEMDGYDTMRAIRADPRFGTLPIITLTAKAMKGDREKCLDAGASDYVAKPVDTGRLVALLRVWLASRMSTTA
jgi:signal transduction histidine kinase/DNA-binding response OmpR family regulator/HAMP domain-containing protein